MQHLLGIRSWSTVDDAGSWMLYEIMNMYQLLGSINIITSHLKVLAFSWRNTGLLLWCAEKGENSFISIPVNAIFTFYTINFRVNFIKERLQYVPEEKLFFCNTGCNEKRHFFLKFFWFYSLIWLYFFRIM